MNTQGWIIFIIANTAVISLIAFCLYRVFSIEQEHMHAPLDIDTHDLQDDDESDTN